MHSLFFWKKKIKLENKSDGSSILLDDFKDIKIAYILGISNITDFDKTLIDKGNNVHIHVHTINILSYKNKKRH